MQGGVQTTRALFLYESASKAVGEADLYRMIGKYRLDEVDMLDSEPEHQDSVNLVPKIAPKAIGLALMLNLHSAKQRLAGKLQRKSVGIVRVEELGSK